MSYSWHRDYFGFVARMVPGTTTILFTLMSLLPFHVPSFGSIAPSFALMAVFHWTVYRPDLLPLGVVFLAGLLLDLLNGTPYVGLSALVLLLVRTGVLSQRRVFSRRPFSVLWLGFLGVAIGAFVFEWAFVSLMQVHFMVPRSFVFQTLVTAACFPIGSYVLALAHRAMPALSA
ncbi:MAG: rod shape-determining protein MreD [Alphaproteobacteria bacterium]|nr:rod shape-determining protein MreD [Alphaproteobacteria bacterium]